MHAWRACPGSDARSRSSAERPDESAAVPVPMAHSPGDGRGAHGAGLLRWSLVELFLVENGAQRGGMLHLNRYLTAGQRALLEALPTEPFELTGALAREFLPRARALMAAHDQPYPDDFERATLAYLDGLTGLP